MPGAVVKLLQRAKLEPEQRGLKAFEIPASRKQRKYSGAGGYEIEGIYLKIR